MSKKYIAEVIKNNSQLSSFAEINGAIQFKIPHFMDDWAEDDYHWALPEQSGTGGSNEHGLSCIPEIGSLVNVYYKDEINWKNARYTDDINLLKYHPHSLYEDNVKNEVNANSSYPDVKYLYLKNGICVALSSDDSNPEITIYHPSNFRIFIDKDGKMDLKNDDSGMKEILLIIHGLLSNLCSPGIYIGNLGAPVIHQMPTDYTIEIPKLLQKIENLLLD